jgi:hypothetical protein
MGWFEDMFILPKAIGIGNDGLHLEYDPYEIRAYAYGTTSLVIPFSNLSYIIEDNIYFSTLLKASQAQAHSKHKSKKFGERNESSITIKSTLLSQNRLKITAIVENMSEYTKGGLSLSFPQLSNARSISNKQKHGFKTLSLYPKGKKIYHIGKKKVIKAKYLLVEAESNYWKRGQSNTLSFELDVPQNIHTLSLNIRTAFRKKKNILSIPLKGRKGQQGFSNYYWDIPLR